MAAIIFLMNTLTGCALKNENMEAIYKEFLDNGDVGSLQWSWVLEPGQYEDIRFVNDNMVAVQNGSDKWGVWDLEKEILVTSCKYNNIPNDAARYYSEGYAAVQKDGKWGFVDEAGQCVIPCQYDEVGDFSEGLAAVKDAGKPVGVNAFDPVAAESYIEHGADFVAVGADVALLARASEALAARFIPAADEAERASY